MCLRVDGKMFGLKFRLHFAQHSLNTCSGPYLAQRSLMIRVEMSDAGVPEGGLESHSFVATDQVVSRRPIAASVGAQ